MLGDDADENHGGELPLGDDASENHHDGEPPDVDLILLLSFSSRCRRRGCRDGGEVVILGDFFGPRPSEFEGFYKKSTCTIT